MNNFTKSLLGVAGLAFAASRVSRRMHRFNLQGKVVAITGGSRGLGLALAEEFIQRGARVAICGRDLSTLQQAKRLLVDRGAKGLHIFQCDITDEQQAKRFIANTESQLDPIDILVNNAGRIEVGPLETTTKQDYEKAMATHFWGPLHTITAVLPAMQARKKGRIVNISSIGGRIGAPHLIPYDASKFAIAGLSEALTAELRKDGIRVTTVYPGLMRTGSPRNANFKGQNEKEYGWFAVSDAAPLLTIGARRAAKKIVNAAIYGDATLVLTPAAKVAILAHDIAPDLVIAALGIMNRLLPDTGGIGKSAAKGRDSESAFTRSPLTALNRAVEGELNQVS
jgi:NAD(P)-dependent dehydrogenase (short-subunit alcohol dehydrogenase family)